jgi:hypothetical protein
MRDPGFRRSQEEGLTLPHIAPINALVDDLRDEGGRGWVPYVAPMYGGIEARMLSVLSDPGPMTDAKCGGSGFLCLENDDPTAERSATLLDEAGIAASDMNPWNAYPWYVPEGSLTARQRAAGVEPLRRLIALLPRLQVVMLHGNNAKDTWKRFESRYPEVARRFLVLSTWHTGRRVFAVPRDKSEARLRDLRDAFASAKRALG